MKKRQSNVPNSAKNNCENLINRQVVMAVIKKYWKIVDFFKNKIK